MEAKKVQQQYLLSKWAATIQECRTTGMSMKDWCLENNVNKNQPFSQPPVSFPWKKKNNKDKRSSLER